MVTELKPEKRMKRNMFMSAVALTAMIVAGCNDRLADAPETSEGTVLMAGFVSEVSDGSEQTKTVLENDKTVKWTAGDRITVNGIASKDAEISDGVTAKFSFDETLKAPYSAVFPSSIYKDAGTVTLPAVQTWKAGSFAETAAPMCACASEGTSLSFDHLCSVVKLTVNKPAADAEKFSCIEFSGNGGEQICGDFAIDYATCALTPSATVNDADRKIRCDVDWNIAADAQVVAYIVVPAGEYPQGFTVKIQDKQGRVMTKSSSAKTLKRGTVHEMPEFSFEQTGMETGVEITTAAELIKFAADYNSGVYAGTENSLVATLMNDIALTDEENAAFVSIGNTGGNKFKGCFNGNSKTISNFNSGKALFAGVHDFGVVKDLTVEGASDVEVTDADLHEGKDAKGETLYEGYNGVLADVSRGLIQRCTTKVAYSVTDKIKVSKQMLLRVGGIAARVQNGKIEDCVNLGALTMNLSKEKVSRTIYIGGIAGSTSSSSVIESCCNNSSISSKMSNRQHTDCCGGIVGNNEGTITYCHNQPEGSISASGYNKNRKIGGVAGANSGTVSGHTTNAATVVVEQGQFVLLGGIIGSNAGTAEVSDIKNIGSVTLKKINTNGGAVMRVGGCVGESTKTSAIIGSSVENTADVTVLSGQDWPKTEAVYVGGVFGYVASSVSGLVNEGAVSFENGHTPNLNAEVYVGGIIGCTDEAITIASCNSEKGSVTISHTEATLNTTTWSADGILGHGPDGVQEDESNICDPEKVTMPEIIR